MNLRNALPVLLASLLTTSAWAQARTAPVGEGPRPAMIVGGHTLTPAAWVDDLTGDTVTIDSVEMLYVGRAAKDAGRTVTFVDRPEGRVLSIRIGIRTMDYLILPPGEFWRHPWVRHLIAQANIYRLQPLPYYPYVEANIPPRPPHHISPRWPYLEWSPDEAWLLLNLQPPPPPVAEPVTIHVPDATPPDPDAPAEVAPAPPPGPPAEAPPPGMGAPPPPGMDEPPPMDY